MLDNEIVSTFVDTAKTVIETEITETGSSLPSLDIRYDKDGDELYSLPAAWQKLLQSSSVTYVYSVRMVCGDSVVYCFCLSVTPNSMRFCNAFRAHR